MFPVRPPLPVLPMLHACDTIKVSRQTVRNIINGSSTVTLYTSTSYETISAYILMIFTSVKYLFF